jgi:hypothetical protein
VLGVSGIVHIKILPKSQEAFTKDPALAVRLHYKTVECAKKPAREKPGLKRSADVTVDKLCRDIHL